MKHIIISYIFYVSLLGSFCLGSPQQSNQNNERNVTTTHETTTAEAKLITQTTPINNSFLTKTSTVATTQKAVAIDSTTAIPHQNVLTTKTVHQHSPTVETSTQNLRSSSIHTTTAMPIKSTSSIGTNHERQFDVLSFMGGSIFTFCLMAIGVVLWKAYKMRIERNYRTI